MSNTETQTTEQTTETTETTQPQTEQTTETETGAETQTEQTSETEKQDDATEEQPKHVAPDSADDYEIGIDGFDLDSFKDTNPEALNVFHEAGLSNEQATAVLQLWEQHNTISIESLQEEWGGEFEQNIRFAQQAAKAAGLKDSDLDSPTMAIKLAAYYGKQLQEDMPPAENAQQNGAESIRDLMSSEAYLNEKHPDHRATFEKVQKFYAKNYID